MTKNDIRKEVREKKKKMNNEQIRTESEMLAEKFFELGAYQKADCIYAYMSYNQEVRTDIIIEKAWKDGKRVAVPKTMSSGKEKNTDGTDKPDYMEFIYINSLEECSEAYMGIPEPNDNLLKDKTKIANEKKVLILMPGLAFDNTCNRMGYGGGFYDKYLAKHKDTSFIKVALCFSFQMYQNIPVESHDEKMDLVVFPEGFVSIIS